MTFNAAQEAIEVVGETEFYILDFGTFEEFYTTARLPVTTDVFTGFTETYQPLPVRRVGVSKDHTTSPDTTKLVLPVLAPFVALIAQSGLDSIRVTIIRGFGTDYANDYRNPWWKGYLVDITAGITTLEGNLKSSEALFSDTFPKVFIQPACNNQVYGPICGLNPSLFSTTRTVTAISEGGRLLSIDGAIPSNDTYTQGFIRKGTQTWRSVRQQAGLDLVLHVAIIGLVVGDTVEILRGCLHRPIEDCQNIFNNKARFVGMPLVPQESPVIDGF